MEGCKLYFNPIYGAEQQQEIIEVCKSEGTIVDQWLSRPPKHFMFVTMSHPDEARRLSDRLHDSIIAGQKILCEISHDPPDANFDTKRSQHSAREPREFIPRTERSYPPRGYNDRAPPPSSYDRGYPPRDTGYPPRDTGYPPRDAGYPPRRDYRPPYEDRRSFAPPPHHDSYGGGHRERERFYERPIAGGYEERPPITGGYEDRQYPSYERPYERRGGGYYDKRDNRRDNRKVHPDSQDGLCYNCSRPGHTSHTCPLPPTAQDQCFFCREIGHKLRDCPARNNKGGAPYEKSDRPRIIHRKHDAPQQDDVPQHAEQQHHHVEVIPQEQHQAPIEQQSEAGYDYDCDQYN